MQKIKMFVKRIASSTLHILKRFPRYFLIGFVVLFFSFISALLWRGHRGGAAGGYQFIRQLPEVSYSLSPTAVAFDSDNNQYVAQWLDGGSGIAKISSSGEYLGMIVTQASLPGAVNYMAADASGNLYISQDSVIKKFANDGTFLMDIGSSGSADGQFTSLGGVAVDAQGRLYATDGGFYSYGAATRIQVFNSETGEFLYKWGSYGSGNGQFYDPNGIAVDSDSNVFVADTYNNRIQKFDSSGSFITKWGSSGSSNGRFLNAYHLVVDSSGNVYVSDGSMNRVQKFDNSGTYLTQWGSYGTGEGQFTSLFDTKYSMTLGINGDDHIFVAGDGSNFGRVQEFDSGGTYVGAYGKTANGQFASPGGIDTDNDGNIYVVDDNNYRIQKFDSNGNFLTKWGSQGSADGQFACSSCNEILQALAIDKTHGWVYVLDEGNLRIQKFDSNGNFLTKWGSSGSGNGQFKWNEISSGIGGIAVGSDGSVFVSDHERIQKFNSDGDFISSFTTESGVGGLASDVAGNIYARTGQKIYKFNSSGVLQKTINWNSTSSAMMQSIAVDQYGDIFVTANYSVYKLNKDGNYIAQLGGQGTGPGQFTAPSGIKITTDGSVYVSDQAINGTRASHRIQVFQDNTQLAITTENAANGATGSNYQQDIEVIDSHGQVSYSISSGLLPAGLSINAETGVISGTPSVSGARTFTVQAQDSLFTATKQFTITISETPVLPDVTTKAIGDQLIYYDAPVNLEGGVRQFNVWQRGIELGLTSSYGRQTIDTGEINYTSIKNFGSTGSSAGGGAAGYTGAWGFNVDAQGNVYVADQGNNVIKKFNHDGTLLSQFGSAGTGNGEFDKPMDVAFDSAGNIYVADLGNNRVQKFDSNGNYLSQFGVPTGQNCYWYGQLSGSLSPFEGRMCFPNQIVINQADEIFVSNFADGRVQKFDSQMNFVTQFFARADGNPYYNWGPLSGPRGLAIDPDGVMYMSSQAHPQDADSGTIVKFDSGGNYLGSWDPRGVEPNDTPYGGMAVDAHGDVHLPIQGGHHRIQEYTASGSPISSWTNTAVNSNGFRSTQSTLFANNVAFSPLEYAYVSTGNEIIKFAGSIKGQFDDLHCGTTYHYRAFATNSAGTAYGEDKTFTTEACPTPDIRITTSSLPNGRVAGGYSATIETEDEYGDRVFSVINGSLPEGLIINANTGVISGTPTQAGTFNVTINVSDSHSADSEDFQIVIDPLEDPLTITTLSLPDGIVGESYSATIETQHEIGEKTYILIAGSLPDGLMHHSQNGTITGTPTEEGEFTFTMRVIDGYSEDQRQYTLVVHPAQTTNNPDPVINITTTTLPNGKVAEQYSGSIQVQHSVGSVDFSVVDGQLPDGLSMNISGIISGVPTNPGLFEFTVEATDVNGSDTQVLQIDVLPADQGPQNPGGKQIYILTQVLPDATVHKEYRKSIRVRNAKGAIQFKIIKGKLPDGLTLSSAGRITGTPTRVQTTTFTVRATDSDGSDREEYVLKVIQEPGVLVLEPETKQENNNLAKEEVVAKELEEIAEYSPALAKPIGVVARELNITPKQVVYGLPWLVVGAFALFATNTSSQSYRQFRAYKASKKRQEFYQELIEEKRTFVSLASHYLRTPVTVIKGGVELIGKAADNVKASTAKLADRVNEIINRLDGGSGD